MDVYKIQLEAFEGPMDLLMHLIEKNKIDIYDIPVASLTQQYMEYLRKFQRFNIEVASEFLVMAATLLLIKARLMLPKPPKEENENAAEDPRQELVARILAYQQYKKASVALRELAERERLHALRLPMTIPVRRLPPENLSTELLWNAFHNMLAVRQELTIPEVIVAQETYRVEEQMTKLMKRLAEREGPLSFAAIFPAVRRSELIVDFLALLELIRRKYIAARQDALFDSIMIKVREADASESEDTEDGTDVFG